jgi:hypothetical protein
VKNGVPFDVAHALEPAELLAHGIVFAQYENGGRQWDWDSMTFVER